MEIEASVSITESQAALARELVREGHYPDLSAVVQRGLELVRAETIRDRSEILALRTFFEERAAGTFLSDADTRAAVERMNAAKLAQHGV